MACGSAPPFACAAEKGSASPSHPPLLWTLARPAKHALHRPPGLKGTDGAFAHPFTAHLDAAQLAGADSDGSGGLGRGCAGLQRYLQLGGHSRGCHPHAPSIHVCSMGHLSICGQAVLQVLLCFVGSCRCAAGMSDAQITMQLGMQVCECRKTWQVL